MLKISESSNLSYNSIFQSAFKALIVFELILESPKTLKEISDYLNKLPYLKNKVSIDSIRTYINSFKTAGCNVERKINKGQKREYTYHIASSPFCPTISDSLAKHLFDIYDIVMYNLPFPDLLRVDRFLKKFVEESKSAFFAELYEKHSCIKNFNDDLLKELQNCCEENSLVTVLYESPRSGKKEIDIIAHNMKIQNYKLYLEGFGMEYKQEAIFLVSRISKITNIVPSENIELPKENFFDITFELYNPEVELLAQEELIAEKSGVRIVKHTSSNKVLTMHRFLQLEESAKILSPKDFRAEFIKMLRATREVYANG